MSDPVLVPRNIVDGEADKAPAFTELVLLEKNAILLSQKKNVLEQDT